MSIGKGAALAAKATGAFGLSSATACKVGSEGVESARGLLIKRSEDEQALYYNNAFPLGLSTDSISAF